MFGKINIATGSANGDMALLLEGEAMIVAAGFLPEGVGAPRSGTLFGTLPETTNVTFAETQPANLPRALPQEPPDAMPLWLFIVLISASGFILAGLSNAFGQIINNDANGSSRMRLFAMSFDTLPRAIGSFFLCMFAGPYWLGVKAWQFWLAKTLPTFIFCLVSLIAIMWSFCSGVVILQVLYFMNLI